MEQPVTLEIDCQGFDCQTNDDALRADNLCQELLLGFYNAQVAKGVDPIDATEWARGADYYLRDFLIDIKRINLFDQVPGAIRQFAGNWYIVSNIEPDMKLLRSYLEGIRRLYGYLAEHGAVTADFLATVEEECSDLEYYQQRLDDFWNISDDGFGPWDRACSFRS